MIHGSDSNGIVLITQLDPITVPSRFRRTRCANPCAPQVRRQAARGILGPGTEDDALARRAFTTDNQVDVSTGTVKLRAQFSNTQAKLFPNHSSMCG